MTGQTRAVGPGAFHPNPHDRTEAFKPRQQRDVAVGSGPELADTELTADAVKRCGHVRVQVGVHAAGDGNV